MVQLNPRDINVIGADANNLRDIDINFPLGGVSMIVGVSGSGKSSLLRDVLASEGNLRLNDFLGIRQDHLDLPMSRSFVGQLPATVHVGQRAFRASSRTTVGTASGLLSLLRQMFIRWSKPVSTVTNTIVQSPGVLTYAQWLFQHHTGEVVIWSIPISFTSTDGVDMAKRLSLLGVETAIVRSETDTAQQWEKGRVVSLSNFKPLSRASRHLVEVEIGRMKIGKQTKQAMQRLQDLLEKAFDIGEGKIFIELPGNKNPDLLGSNGASLDSRCQWVMPGDPRVYRPPDMHMLTFNSPDHEASGACPECQGRGKKAIVDAGLLVSNPNKSMHDGAFSLWTPKNYKYVNIQHDTVEGLRGMSGFDPDLPWNKLGEDARQLVLNGSGSELVVDLERGTRRKMSKPGKFHGFLGTIMRHFAKGSKTSERLAFLMREGPCPTCQGTRWSHAARALKLNNLSIDMLLKMNFEELQALCHPDSDFSRSHPIDAAPFLAQLFRLATSLVGVGLSHLSGDRGMLHVSEGESRRIRLAAVFDGRHEGLCLLLDEPARGLHDEDVVRLADTLSKLRGPHTLIINEHRQRLAGAADHFVELGPGAGPHGGTIVCAGSVPEQWWQPASNMKRESRVVKANHPHMKIRGACWNNLLDVDVDLPLGHLICITGVSGSGKSSFVHGVLSPALTNAPSTGQGRWTKVEGAENIGGVISLDQRTPPANRRSTVATFLDVAKLLRNHFGKLPEAAAVGLIPSDFGFNSGNGRCQKCLGIGETKDGEHWIPCASCGGVRFENLVLSIRDSGLNLAQVLDKPIVDLVSKPLPVLETIVELLVTIQSLGLGHLSLGRRLDTLSGGEVQRLRIARELTMNSPEGLVFLLDEPASGLHKKDVANLLKALDFIVAHGKNTVILVEHNLRIVSASDWVVEFGPGSGPKGGRVVAIGPPAEIRTTDTATGRMLRTLGKPAEATKKTPLLSPDSAFKANADAADCTLRWLRRLLGDDIPPLAHANGMEEAQPTVRFCPQQFADTRLIEYGGLDRELISLFLELQQLTDQRFDPDSFIQCWQNHPNARLVVHPLIHEMYVWGIHVPSSLINDRRKQLTGQGYQWISSKSISGLRVGGHRLSCPADADQASRQEILATALAIGTGYVELLDGERFLASHTNRHIDLDEGLVGPMGISPFDLQRSGQRGRCLACKGSGMVTIYDHKHLLSENSYPAEDRNFLHGDALSILKGVHRNVLLPFLKRLTREGLWTPGIPVHQLTKERLNLILHGYWSRPGPGSFLKSPKSKPDEVSSWLRWDGLFSHIQENAHRGSDEWRKQLLGSAKQGHCPTCDGLGLQPYVNLIKFGDLSYRQWVESGSVEELCESLRKLQPESPRIQQRCSRLLTVLSPLLQKGYGASKLFGLLNNGPVDLLVPLVVANFTRMPLLMEKTK